MPNIITLFLSQSILIPLIIGLVRMRKLKNTYYPFLILLVVGTLSEVVSSVLIDYYHTSNAIVIKIYSLLECLLILYQFYVWKNHGTNRRIFVFLLAFCVVFWLVEAVVFRQINTFSPYFRVFYAFVIVLFSINQINAMMFRHDGPLFKSPRFLLCLGFIIFFLYQILLEASFFVSADPSAYQSEVADKIIVGFSYINFTINLLYAVALLFVSDKKDDYNYYFNEQ